MKKELNRVMYEIKVFGKPLLALNRPNEYRAFWKMTRKRFGIKWYQFWKDETNIIK